MPTTKLYFKKVAIPSLLIVLTSFLGFLGAKSDIAIPVAIYGLAILGAGGAVRELFFGVYALLFFIMAATSCT